LTFVIDTSVATKLLVNEPDSKEAAACFEHSQVIAAPAIFKIELVSACIIQWRLRGISAHQIATQIAIVNSFFDPLNMTLCDNEEDFSQAVALAIFYRHRVADCLYVVLAKRLLLPLLSADNKQKKIAVSEGVKLVQFGLPHP
jgi:predicted nucleic acid-binding protein